MAKKLSDFLQLEKFHQEIESEPISFKDILNEHIEIFDCSGDIPSKGGKYDSKSKLINFSYLGEKDRLNGWVSGEVVIDQLNRLLDKEALPSLDEGIAVQIILYKKDDKTEYYKMVDSLL